MAYYNFDDEKFSILNVADLLGLRYKQRGNNWIVEECPFCGGKWKMSLSPETKDGKKNVFKCVKCVDKHGSSVKLYALVKGIDTKEASKQINGDAKVSENTYKRMQRAKEYKEKTNLHQIKDELERDRVYRAFLSKLTLDGYHLSDLLKRGFAKAHIDAGMYKSIPQNENIRLKICEELINEGYPLAGIPGFFKNRKGQWDFINYKGYLVPFTDHNMNIPFMQARIDYVRKGGKYKAFSSGTLKDGQTEGTEAQTTVHVSYNSDMSMDKIIVTEGALKGNIITRFTNTTVFATAGVNSRIPELVDLIALYDPKEVVIAFDMDILDTPEVLRALMRLKDLLDAKSLKYSQKLWIEEYEKDKNIKGADDYLLYMYKKQRQNRNVVNQNLNQTNTAI